MGLEATEKAWGGNRKINTNVLGEVRSSSYSAKSMTRSL